jgi:hypothetical protein
MMKKLREGVNMSKAYEVLNPRADIYRIVLEEDPVGVYVLVFLKEGSAFPEYDYLQDDFDMAMRACQQDYGVLRDAWKEIPFQDLH